MTTIALVGALVAVVLVLVAVVVWAARTAGEARAEAEAAARIGRRRRRFDDAVGTPIEGGERLLRRLRAMRDRRLRDNRR